MQRTFNQEEVQLVVKEVSTFFLSDEWRYFIGCNVRHGSNGAFGVVQELWCGN